MLTPGLVAIAPGFNGSRRVMASAGGATLSDMLDSPPMARKAETRPIRQAGPPDRRAGFNTPATDAPSPSQGDAGRSGLVRVEDRSMMMSPLEYAGSAPVRFSNSDTPLRHVRLPATGDLGCPVALISPAVVWRPDRVVRPSEWAAPQRRELRSVE